MPQVIIDPSFSSRQCKGNALFSSVTSSEESAGRSKQMMLLLIYHFKARSTFLTSYCLPLTYFHIFSISQQCHCKNMAGRCQLLLTCPGVNFPPSRSHSLLIPIKIPHRSHSIPIKKNLSSHNLGLSENGGYP